MKQTIEHTCLLFAMHGEAQTMIETLGLTLDPEVDTGSLPCRIYTGEAHGIRVSLVTYGKDERYDVDFIGPIAAALTTMKVGEALNPDLVISCGTAGGFAKRGASIGTVYLSQEQCIFHDRRVPLPGFDESGIGHFPVLDVSKMASKLELPTGIISSGSSLKKSEQDLAVMDQFEAVAKEMEAASIALVCELQGLPFFCIKSITNLLDQDGASEAQFQVNFEHSVLCLHREVVRVLAYCAGKRLSDLGF